MERKKEERSEESFPNEANKLFSQYKQKVSLDHSQSINDSLFFKYASSIIQVVAEDKLDRDERNATLLEHTDPIYESSELNYYETESAVGQVEPHAEEQNTYNEVRFKMKKKYPNKQLLVYNFSNFTCFTSNLNHVFKKPVRVAFEALRVAAHPTEHAKAKKDKKKTSFYSAYTTSTNSDQKMFKIQSGRMVDVRRIEQLQDAAHRIMGWVEFKQMIIASSAFKEIADWAKTRLTQTKKMSSTIKNDIPLSNFCLSDYQNDQSLSIARDMPDHIEESLVYTADHNFQFSEKQMTITTPEKYAYHHERNPSLNVKLKGSQTEVVGEFNRPTPKSPPSVMFKPIKKEAINYKTMVTIKPINLELSEERRYLVLRTNMYQLPLISTQDLRPQVETRMKELPINVDYLQRSEPESICDMIDNTIKQLQEAFHAFSFHNSTRSPQNKSIESSFNSKDNNIQGSNASGYVSNPQKLSKMGIDNSKTETEKGTFGSRAAVRSHNEKIEQMSEHNRVQSINYGVSSSRNRKNIEDNYYSGTEIAPKVLERYTSEVRSPDVVKEERKEMGDEVRSVDSYINIVPNEQEKKDKKKPNLQENAVKNYVISDKVEKKEVGTGVAPVRREEYHKIEERKLEYGSKGVPLGQNQGEKKVNNAPKMNIMVTSPRKVEQNIPPAIQINPPRRLQINLGSPRPQERQPFMSNPPQIRPQSPRIISPDVITIKPKIQSTNQISSREKVMQPPSNNNIYQLNHGVNMANRQYVQQHQQPQKIMHAQDMRPIPQTVYQQPINNNQQQMQVPKHMRAGLQGQTRIETIVRNPNRLASPSPSNPIQYHPQHSPSPLMITKKQQPPKKPMNLPQILHRQVYTQGSSKSPDISKPQSPPYHIRMMSQPSQEYFLRQQHSHLQQKAVNFNNNYYTTGTVPKMVPPIVQANRNVFQQQMDAQNRQKKSPMDRPITSVRQSTDRTNLFSNYSPIDSQVEGPQRSNHFSRNSSQISRPKSMNEKIHLTLRRDK